MKRARNNIILVIASIGFAFLIGEVALRILVGNPIHWRYPQELYDVDTEVGHWLRPNQKSFTHDKRVEVNSLGIRDRDYPREPAPGTRRIIALGDSQTFGNGVESSETWPKRLEQALNQQDGKLQWEVLNAGLAATFTWQQKSILKRLTRTYKYDAVILGFYSNDVSPKRALPNPVSDQDNSWTRRIGYQLKRSAFLTAIWQAPRALRPSRGSQRETRILTGELDPVVEEGWKQVQQSLRAIKTLAQEQNAKLIVLVLPRRDQVDGSQAGKAYNRRIEEIADREDIPSVDVLTALQNAYTKHGRALFITWDGHNSAVANEVIGRELAKSIVTVDLLKQRPQK